MMDSKLKVFPNYTIQMDDASIIGSGQYGEVRKGYNNQTKKTIACKIIQLSEQEYKLVEREKEVLYYLCSKVNSQNIVQLYEYILTQNRLYLFSEYCSNGNLRQLMQQKELSVDFDTLLSGFTESEVDKIMSDITQGYKVLYQCQVVHRDLKPENIVIEGNHYKIADFGFARFVPNQYEQKQEMTQMRCTPIYGAPQLLLPFNKDGYSALCDVWSLGIIYYELIFGQKPYPKYITTYSQLINCLNEIKEKKISKPPGKYCPERMWTLLQKMLEFEEEKRLTWHEIFEQNYFPKNQKQISQQFQHRIKI